MTRHFTRSIAFPQAPARPTKYRFEHVSGGLLNVSVIALVEKLTIDQIAKMAYVSRSVVSRVINNHSNVSDEARERVQRVVEKYNYTPNAAARSLVTSRSYEISLLAPRKDDEVLANAFWPLLLTGITEMCNEHGYLVSLSMVSDKMKHEIRRRILSRSDFDGFVVVGQQVSELVGSALHRKRAASVVIGARPTCSSISYIDAGNAYGGVLAVQHLVELGHERIGVITGVADTQETRERLSGYMRALTAAGIEAPRELQAEGDYSEKSGYEAMKRLLRLTTPPTAVFCMCDAMALGAILAINETGRVVPRDLSVVGYDDLPFSGFTSPPLTTIHQPVFEMGGVAARCVIDQVEGRIREPVTRRLDVTLTVRRTTAPPPS